MEVPERELRRRPGSIGDCSDDWPCCLIGRGWWQWAGLRHARQVRRTERDELAGRMQAWLDSTRPEERGPAGAVVLLGVIAVPIQLCTVVVVGVALVRRLQGRRAGLLQRLVLGGVVGVQAVLQLARWAVLRRLYRALADFEHRPAR